ncbi:MAG: hypothetical protein MHM6MM_002602 [Cercozoa sp. M6MM]
MSDTDEEFCARVDVEQKMPRRSTRTRRRRHVFETETRETEAALRLALRISLGEKVDAEEAAAVARGERRKRRRQQTRRTVEVNTDGSTATSSTGNSGSDEIFTKPSRDLRFVPDAERYSVALPRVSSRGRRVKRTASFSVENAVHEEQIRRALALSLKEEEQRKRRQQLEAESQRLMCLKCGHSNSNSTERRRIIPCTGSVVRVRSFLPQFLRTNRHSLKDGENWQSLCCMHGKCDACLLEEVKLTDETAAESNGLFDTVRVTCPKCANRRRDVLKRNNISVAPDVGNDVYDWELEVSLPVTVAADKCEHCKRDSDNFASNATELRFSGPNQLSGDLSQQKVLQLRVPKCYHCPKLCDSYKLEIINANQCGYGLRTLRALKQGALLGLYHGDRFLADSERAKNQSAQEREYQWITPAVDQNEGGMDVLCALRHGGVVRMVNHSCSPNCRVVYFQFVQPVEDEDDQEEEQVCSRVHVAYFALRDIMRGEELTVSYNYPVQHEVRCGCGANNCRNWLR